MFGTGSSIMWSTWLAKEFWMTCIQQDAGEAQGTTQVEEAYELQ
jgi:hypothetical protein